MAELDLTSYAGLKAAIASYLNRQDLTDQIPAFIRLAEAKFNRELRVRDMETRAEAETSGERIAVPSDFLQEISLEIDDNDYPLDYVGELEAKEKRALYTTGDPRWYTIFGGFFEVIPPPSDTYDFDLKYFARIPALSASNDTNWLLEKSPDLYVYGALMEASPYLKNDERIVVWSAGRDKVIADMQLESERAQRSTTRLVTKRRSY